MYISTPPYLEDFDEVDKETFDKCLETVNYRMDAIGNCIFYHEACFFKFIRGYTFEKEEGKRYFIKKKRRNRMNNKYVRISDNEPRYAIQCNKENIEKIKEFLLYYGKKKYPDITPEDIEIKIEQNHDGFLEYIWNFLAIRCKQQTKRINFGRYLVLDDDFNFYKVSNGFFKKFYKKL